MKTLQKITFVALLFTLFSSCQTDGDVTQILSKPETRKEIMDSIANNSEFSQEMIETIWNSKNGRTMMQGNGKMMGRFMGNHEGMMNMFRNNPEMMQNLITDMMDAAKTDSSMISLMSDVIMRNPQMMSRMNRMNNMQGGNGNMNKLDRMNNGGMNNGGMNNGGMNNGGMNKSGMNNTKK